VHGKGKKKQKELTNPCDQDKLGELFGGKGGTLKKKGAWRLDEKKKRGYRVKKPDGGGDKTKPTTPINHPKKQRLSKTKKM